MNLEESVAETPMFLEKKFGNNLPDGEGGTERQKYEQQQKLEEGGSAGPNTPP